MGGGGAISGYPGTKAEEMKAAARAGVTIDSRVLQRYERLAKYTSTINQVLGFGKRR